MLIRRLILAGALGAIASGALPASAAPAEETHSGWCALAAFQVSQVASLYRSEQVGKQAVQRLVGAQLFLPAQPGLTPEWIRANLAQHVAEHRPSYDCPLDVAGATATIASGGTGFWVQISGKDADAAREILKRSKLLVR